MNIYDIAKKAGVSIATVSRVVNGHPSVSAKTQQRVEQVMEELGYKPNVFARGLMVNSMKVVGIMTIDVCDFYYAKAIHTIEVEMREKGYDVILCSTGEDIREKKKYLKLLREKRVDGIILVGSVFKEKSDNAHILEAARELPVVLINGLVKGENIYSILCDDARAVYSAVQLLAEKGHRDIRYIYDSETFSGYEKIAGFKKAMAEKGFSLDSDSIMKTPKGIDGGYRAVETLLKKGSGFTALITSEDILAAGALKKLSEVGRKVPDEVAVIGFDNSVISQCTSPSLTSVDSKAEAISSAAAKLLVDLLQGKNVPAKTVMTPELVIRETT